MRNVAAFEAPRFLQGPVVQADEPRARFGIGMLDAQRVATAALDHRQRALAFVETDHARRCIAVALQFDTALQRLAVERQLHAAFGSEEDAALLLGHHAHLRRTHDQLDAAGRPAADEVRLQFDPVQAHQAGPAIRRQELAFALFAPGCVVGEEAGIDDLAGGVAARVAIAAPCQHPQQHGHPQPSCLHPHVNVLAGTSGRSRSRKSAPRSGGRGCIGPSAR